MDQSMGVRAWGTCQQEGWWGWGWGGGGASGLRSLSAAPGAGRPFTSLAEGPRDEPGGEAQGNRPESQPGSRLKARVSPRKALLNPPPHPPRLRPSREGGAERWRWLGHLQGATGYQSKSAERCPTSRHWQKRPHLSTTPAPPHAILLFQGLAQIPPPGSPP